MRKFNEWLNEIGLPPTPATNAPANPAMSVQDALEKGDISNYLRLIQRITGQQVYDPKLVQALRRVISVAPNEMTEFLQVLGNMSVGQQGRAQQGVQKLMQ